MSAPDFSTKEAALLTDVFLAVFRVNGRLLQKGDELVAPVNLTSARWQMLGAIAMSGEPLAAPQIGAAMGVSRQGAQKQLNLLMAEKLVRALPNPRSQRSPLYELTTAGAHVYQRAVQLNVVWTERLAQGIGPARLKGALELLEDIYQRLDSPVPAPSRTKKQ